MSATAKKTICLNMIVKNEAHIIADTLEHLHKFIKFDYWVISDTGSTDKTKEIITEFYKKKGIPGKLVEHAWKDFGFNRSAAFAAAYNKTDYAFVWDADDEIAGDFVMPTNLTADSYKFIFGNDSGFRYSRGQLFNNRKRWIYKGVLHEYADCLEPTGPMESVLGNYYFISGRKGDRSKDPNKYLKDALVLEKGFAEAVEQKDHISNRYAFYCAQSYASCNMHEKAIEWYKKSLTLNLWIQERFICCMEIYEQYEKLKRAEEGLTYLVESYKYDSTRVECIYRLVKHYCIHGPPEVAYMYYTLIQDFFENKYLTGENNISDKLFAKKEEHDFYLPYYMVIVAERAKHLDVCGKMYDMIATQQYMYVGEWWVRNLIHNVQFCMNNLPKNLGFLQRFLEYIAKLKMRGVTFEPNHYTILGKVIDTYRPLLTAESPLAKTLAPTSTSACKVFLSFTTCKRFDLFEKTMNSILNTWTDIDKVDYFFCVDDNSTQRDRSKMAKAYPFLHFHNKTKKEKGHRQSMNIIFDKLKELKPTYWIHLEDDWLFFQNDSYVAKSIAFLEKYKSRGINQILFNRNYTEVYDQWDTNGGEPLEPGFTVHLKSDTIPGRNCGYWPHYSFRPSMTRVETILELGNYDSANTFFERDYADKYFAKGYKSGFYDTICSIHIGKLTSDKTGTNAYTLNNAGQFNELAQAKKPSTFIVNLIRRTDRKEAMEELFDKEGIKGYEFYEAVDGQTLAVTDEITELFIGNDFGSRKGFIGCALSHYDIWKQLLADSTNEHYTVFEDDITLVDGFKSKYDAALLDLSGTEYDMLFLGYTQRDKEARSTTSKVPRIPLDIGKYIGGFFGYVITKSGAKKLEGYIQKHGIKHGIDFIIKLIPGFVAFNLQPHIVMTEWVVSFTSPVDTDIQKDYTSLKLVNSSVNKEDWTFHAGLDSGGGDIQSVGGKSVEELFAIASANPSCVAFNTLGFLKSRVRHSLITSPWLSAPHGIYIKKSYVRRMRVKMICNWCSSKELCDEWLKLTKGNYCWNDLQITWEDNDIDYYVIINKPKPDDVFVPEKTVIFHMEPWCGESWQTWGVKTWGEWSRPDPTKFIEVRTHDKFMNTGFWQLNMTYTELKEKTITKSDLYGSIVSSICSSKYFDPGHKKRIDFMKFIEAKADTSVQLHIYNEDNQHGFASYAGKARPFVDKEKGILPYKYYFMCENNAEKNFITEKLWEPILCESLCFYWGCPNVADYIDPLAYVQLDMDDFEGSFQTMKAAIEQNLWEQRLPAIKEAKELILEKYGFFPLLEGILKKKDDGVANGSVSVSASASVVKTACFIHSCHLQSSGTEKLDLLLDSMKVSGLLPTFDLIVINNIGLPLKEDNYKALHPAMQVIQCSSNTQLFELPTLKLMYQFSLENPNCKVLYLHTKGISYLKDDYRYQTGLDWIQYMLYFLVGPLGYKNCLRLLDTHDTAGCNFSQKPHPHYSGNFWWATTNYLKTLSVGALTDKMSAEWWLLSGNSNKVVLHMSNKNHFSQSYKLQEYCKKTLVVYTYFSSPSSDYNLDFYCKHAITESVEVDYIIVINGDRCPVHIPTKSNLKVIYFGGHKAALDSLNGKRYDYYMFINSVVLGPFIPVTEHDPTMPHWVHRFTTKITDKVKLVGTSFIGESLVVDPLCCMTDQIGLDLMIKDGTIFDSNCILKHGYSIDCIVERLGEPIDPFEVVFHTWYWANPKNSDVDIDTVRAYVKQMESRLEAARLTVFGDRNDMGPFTEFYSMVGTLTSLNNVNVSYKTYTGVPIIFQTKQLSYTDNATALLESIPANTNVLLIDYSLTNIKILRDAIGSSNKRITTVHFPILYNPYLMSLFTLYDKKEYDIGCLFGCKSERRMTIVNQLREKGLSVFIIDNWDMQGKLYELSKCKLLLNIHYNDKYTIFEYTRCTFPILLGIPVLSELSDTNDDNSNPYLNELVSNVYFEPYDMLVDKAVELIKSDVKSTVNLRRLKELSDVDYASVNAQLTAALASNPKVDKTVCFIHSCNAVLCGTEILDRLLDSIKTSGLLQILDSIVINNVGLPLDHDKYRAFHPSVKILEDSNTQLYEIPTLKLVHQYSMEHPNVKVLYLHTKGISYRPIDHTYSKNVNWVNYMLYFLVHRYSSCITKLNTHDTVGCDYSTLAGNPHYAGNFWWATTTYLKTLFIDRLKEKHDAEWWLLSGNPNKYIAHTSNFDWYSIDGDYTLNDYSQDDAVSVDCSSMDDTILRNHCKCVSLIEVSRGGGLCNQLMAFLSGIWAGIQEKKSIIIIDEFNPQIETLGSIRWLPAKQVFDLDAMNALLSKYSITLIDKHDLTYSIISVDYGTDTVRHTITREVLDTYVHGTVLYIPAGTDLNKIKGDPMPNVEKKLYLKYSIAGQIFEDSFREAGGLHRTICLNTTRISFTFQFHWINHTNNRMFNEFTEYIRFHSSYVRAATTFLSSIQDVAERLNVIHVRNEDDGIKHWSKQNRMSPEDYKRALESKYIALIEQHVPKDEPLVLLTYDTESSIIKYLNVNNYKYAITSKTLEGREQNAIVDLLIGSRATGVFIGNFNTEKLRGSSFSYTILQMLGKTTRKYLLDLDEIKNDVIDC